MLAIWTMDGVEVAWTLTLANLCPRRERQYVDCDTHEVDCAGSVMDNAVAFANMNAFFTEGLATRTKLLARVEMSQERSNI